MAASQEVMHLVDQIVRQQPGCPAARDLYEQAADAGLMEQVQLELRRRAAEYETKGLVLSGQVIARRLTRTT